MHEDEKGVTDHFSKRGENLFHHKIYYMDNTEIIL